MSTSKKNRTEKTVKNSMAGLLTQVITMLLTFISRTIFINYLSTEYLGLNNLFTSLLSMLSLADLGLGTVMNYSLYKPIANQNFSKINSLLTFYQNLYRKIALGIGLIGVALLPFLDDIANTTLPINEVFVYYIVFLINSVISYLIADKRALIIADEKLYIIRRIELWNTVIKNVLQIILLILFQDFLVYTLIMVLSALLTNISIYIYSRNKYSFLKNNSYINELQIEESDQRIIINNVKATFLYKIGTTIINNTDNIVISITYGATILGLYSNYEVITMGLDRFINVLNQALIPSLGNLNSENKSSNSSRVFFIIIHLYHLMAAFVGVSLFLLLNDFMTIWIGHEYILQTTFVLVLSLSTYQHILMSPVWMFRETMGLFGQMKYVMLISAGINVLLSVILTRWFGISGVIIATILSRLLTTGWYEPIILFKEFGLHVKEYWKRQIYYVLLTAIVFVLSTFITQFMGSSFFWLVIRGLSYLLITVVVFFIGTIFTNENNEIRKYMRNLFRK